MLQFLLSGVKINQKQTSQLQVNGLFGSPLSKAQLVQAGLESEATVSGYHADNVAPSLMGGFVLVRSYSPLHLIPLSFPEKKSLYFVLVIPDFEAPTKEMRAVLPSEVRPCPNHFVHKNDSSSESKSKPCEVNKITKKERLWPLIPLT